MDHLAEYNRYKREGCHGEATNFALDALETNTLSRSNHQNLALTLFRDGATAPRLLASIESCLPTSALETAEDFELVLAHAQLAWIKDQRDPEATRARDSARRIVERAPDLPDGYRILGLAHLCRQEYRDAYVTFSAAASLNAQVNYENFRNLSKLLMQGVSPVAFELDGTRYKFDLTTHNAEAIESSAFHSVGLLTEVEELNHLKGLTSEKNIEHIVEVGVLLGNHTAFFLKQLSPARMTLFDADSENRPFIEKTVSYNAPADIRESVALNTMFVTDAARTMKIAGQSVEANSLDAKIDTKVDFMKIDVDGGEIDLLKGAEQTITHSRPMIMIETAPATHAAVKSWFEERNYKMDRVFDRGGYSNVFFLPQ